MFILILGLISCTENPTNLLAIDNDGDGFSEFEGDCDDGNPDTYPGAAELDSTELCMTDKDDDGYGSQNNEGLGSDCDDEDASLLSITDDQDCDRIRTADDCDDHDPQSTVISEDQDCDGVLTADDCDDSNPNTVNDMDCDGVWTVADCDDADENLLSQSEDQDCDGVLTADDCDDNDSSLLAAAIDSDCDGVLNNGLIASGGFHSCALSKSGKVVCWGAENSSNVKWGQNHPPDKNFVQLAAGQFLSCGVTESSLFECWHHAYGFSPGEPLSSHTYAQVSAGQNHACGVRTSGSIDCWGYPSSGLYPPSGSFVSVSAGHENGCALKSNGIVDCWGIVDPSSSDFVQISVGYSHACGVKSNGSVDCWAGLVSPTADGFIQVSVGNGHACGVKSNGALECWGSNTYGQSTPPVGMFAQVDSGYHHTCGVRRNGAVECWGDNTYNQSTPPVGLTVLDTDGDGYKLAVDCDDEDASSYPGAIDIPNDGIDQDCDGQDYGSDSECCYTLEMSDNRGDGWRRIYVQLSINDSFHSSHTVHYSSQTGYFCLNSGDDFSLYLLSYEAPHAYNDHESDVMYSLFDQSQTLLLSSPDYFLPSNEVIYTATCY